MATSADVEISNLRDLPDDIAGGRLTELAACRT